MSDELREALGWDDDYVAAIREFHTQLPREPLEIVWNAARDHLACVTVTDEMVEAAAKTHWELTASEGDGKWEDTSSGVRDWARADMRAALEAAFRVETGEQE